MENPQTWNEAQKTIDRVLREHMERDDEIYGQSLTTRIYEALLDGGFLK